MNKQAVYQGLEAKMLKYKDLAEVPVRPVREKLVCLKQTKYLVINPIDLNMRAFTGDNIYVRQRVAKMLATVSQLIQTRNSRLQLEVVYGYRALSIQQRLFLKYKRLIAKKFVDDALLEAVHRIIAVPKVAGHPTGGAVDVQILKSSVPLDMGTKIWQFDQDSYTYSPFITKQAKSNRQLLRETMVTAGFAPFDGEWWHYSYGDREWAKYYQQPYAIYEQVEFKKKV